LPGVFYGWFIAAAGACISFMVVGVGFYGMAVFLDALCVERGWPRTSVSFATTLYFVMSGLGGSLIGRSVDRRGSRYWMLAGSVLMALGLVALGRVESIPQLIGVYLVLASGFAMTGPVPSSALITRWFEGRRARAMSIAQTGVSAGGIVLVPVMTRLIESGGLAAATDRLALALVAVVVPLTCFVLRSDPRRHGLEPDGVAATSRMDPEDAVARGPVWTLPATLRSRTFWQLVLAFGGILFCQVGAGMHQLSRLRVDLEPETAALAVSTTAFGSLVARLVVGGFADRVDQRRLGSALIGVQALALFGFSQVSAVGSLFAVHAPGAHRGPALRRRLLCERARPAPAHHPDDEWNRPVCPGTAARPLRRISRGLRHSRGCGSRVGDRAARSAGAAAAVALAPRS
jgi:sugar phosphate permease